MFNRTAALLLFYTPPHLSLLCLSFILFSLPPLQAQKKKEPDPLMYDTTQETPPHAPQGDAFVYYINTTAPQTGTNPFGTNLTSYESCIHTPVSNGHKQHTHLFFIMPMSTLGNHTR
jgi:hypothetical protein